MTATESKYSWMYSRFRARSTCWTRGVLVQDQVHINYSSEIKVRVNNGSRYSSETREPLAHRYLAGTKYSNAHGVLIIHVC